MSLRADRGARRSGSHSVDGDLNLLPMMNIIIVLIPMLLLSAVFIEIRAIEMQRAQAAAAAAEAGLDLAVRITDGAYVIEGRGIAPVSVARSADTAPGAAAGDLTRALAAIAAAHPGERGVRILAGPRVRYEELVALMDAARAAGLPEAALEGTGAEA